MNMKQEQEKEKNKLREMTEHEIEEYFWNWALTNWKKIGWTSPPKLGILQIRRKNKPFMFPFSRCA
jgi:hypothetical protein